MRSSVARVGVVALITAVASIDAPVRADFVTFSTGFGVPETISPIPAGFGSLGGNYLVPSIDNTTDTSTLRIIPTNGGPSSTFVTQNYSVTGGLFLPSSFGSLGGQYLAVGFSNADSTSRFSFINGNGVVTGPTLLQNSSLTTPTLAPSSFGSFGGQVLISNQGSVGSGSIVAMNSDASTSTFVGNLSIRPFGMAFAPQGFGGVGGRLLVNDANSGLIEAIASNGTVQAFTTVAVATGQTGLRQMTFIPPGFGTLGGGPPRLRLR